MPIDGHGLWAEGGTRASGPGFCAGVRVDPR